MKAPGHTPGSQMIYVILENGTEYLFIGDSTWHMDGVRQIKVKDAPWIKEDEPAILAQLTWLNGLLKTEKNLVIVASHDDEQRKQYIEKGLLGRALVHDPSVLVLDEPTSGLDLKACFQYLDLLRTQIRKGKTVLLVTHHLHEIPPEIERVVLLKEGQIVADGSKANLLTDINLSRLFDQPVTLVRANGWYQALPG